MAVKSKSPKTKSFRDLVGKTLSTIKTETFHLGFTHIDLWSDVCNDALNFLLSNTYDRGFLYGRTAVLYGESGSAKSLLMAQMAGAEQKSKKAFVLWVDVEHATDDKGGEEWLRNAGVDIDGDFQYVRLATIAEAQKFISEFVGMYKTEMDAYENGKDGAGKPPPIVVCYDSYSAMLTESQFNQMVDGTMVGDQGQKAKQLGDFILKMNHLLAGKPILVVGVFHVYDNQQMIQGRPVGGKHKTTGGNKPIYMAS